MTTNKINAVLDSEVTAETQEANKDIIAFGLGIDFTPLFEAVSRKLGLCDTLPFPKLVIEEGRNHNRGTFRISCESVNLVDRVGIFGTVMERVILGDFGSSLHTQKLDAEGKLIDRYGDNKDAEVASTRFAMWIDLNFCYSFSDGGSNGNDFAFAWYNDEEGWAFKFVEPRERD